MNPSAQKHNIARARVIAERTQKEFAALIDCPLPTLQAVELGKLLLPDEVGLRASLELDVPFDWLQKNDLNTPVLTRYGESYERVHFIFAQSEKSDGRYPDARFFPSEHYEQLLSSYGRIFRVCGHLAEGRADRIQIVLAKLERLITNLETEFGTLKDSEFSDATAVQFVCSVVRDHGREARLKDRLADQIEERKEALDYLRERSEKTKAADVPALIRDLRNETAARYVNWQKRYAKEIAEKQSRETKALRAALKKSAEERRKAPPENPALTFYKEALQRAATESKPDDSAA